MKILTKLLLLLLTLNMFFCAKVAFSNDTKSKCSEKNMYIDLNINKETAIKIAEAIFEQLYGPKVLEQRPWNIFDNGSTYEIRGTFNKQGCGGVAKIIINKSDGQVLYYMHGK